MQVAWQGTMDVLCGRMVLSHSPIPEVGGDGRGLYASCPLKSLFGRWGQYADGISAICGLATWKAARQRLFSPVIFYRIRGLSLRVHELKVWMVIPCLPEQPKEGK